MDDNSEWLAAELCAALHALSQDSAAAGGLEQADLRRPERLALMFGNAVLKAIDQPQALLSPALLKSLNDLAALLNTMSAQSSALWTEEAVLNDPAWREVQALAREALSELGVGAENGRLH
jgi:hypothetical protein